MSSLYDGAGRKIAEIDAEGRRTEYAYDPLGRLTERTNLDTHSPP